MAKTEILVKLILICLLCSTTLLAQSEWKPAGDRIKTRWAAEVNPEASLPEYPRPGMIRSAWKSLNGLWDFAVTQKGNPPAAMQGEILVPFAIESSLSGVGQRISADQQLWYERKISIPAAWRGKRVLLHFEAVDWETQVWLNGQAVGTHRGGYAPFSFDITNYLVDGDNALRVGVWDPTDTGEQPRGKQVTEPGGIYYTPVTGIWQSVWLEPVPETAIESFQVTPDLDAGMVSIAVRLSSAHSQDAVKISVIDGQNTIVTSQRPAGVLQTMSIPEPKVWHPDSPFLYDLRIEVLRDGKTIDRVDGYFGLRKISVERDQDGFNRLFLNNAALFQAGPLDQGYWPGGLYTAPADEALKFDLEKTKEFGFNMLRKHVKLESRRFYSWCDRLGVLVWQDMPSSAEGIGRNDEDFSRAQPSASQFEFELQRMIATHFNSPSIIMWVIFNEGWGQYDSHRLTSMVRAQDPTRLINTASGWTDRGSGDVIDIHSYPEPRAPEPEPVRASVLGEFGGLGLNIAEHAWHQDGWGYALLQTKDALAARMESLMQKIPALRSEQGLAAIVYTQTTDIESENNGLMTYDRAVDKIAPARMRDLLNGYFAPQLLNDTRNFALAYHIKLACQTPGSRIYYTLDGSEPGMQSAEYTGEIGIYASTTLKAIAHWPDDRLSPVMHVKLNKLDPMPAVQFDGEAAKGLRLAVYHKDVGNLPDFSSMTPDWQGVTDEIREGLQDLNEKYILRFSGYVKVNASGLHSFYVNSDDGSKLYIDDKIIVDNDGRHGPRERRGEVVLEPGWHRITLAFFQSLGGQKLELAWQPPQGTKTTIPADLLWHSQN